MLINTRKRDCYTHRFLFEIAERETILKLVNIFSLVNGACFHRQYTITETYCVLCYDWIFLNRIKPRKWKLCNSHVNEEVSLRQNYHTIKSNYSASFMSSIKNFCYVTSHEINYKNVFSTISPVNAISKLARTNAQSPEEDNQNENDNQQHNDDDVIHNVKSRLVTRPT